MSLLISAVSYKSFCLAHRIAVNHVERIITNSVKCDTQKLERYAKYIVTNEKDKGKIMKLYLMLFLCFFNTNAFAFSLFGPKDYDECILESTKGVTSDEAAIQIRRSCYKKFGKKLANCNPVDFTAAEMSKLQAHGGVQSYGWFTGAIYNGGQKTIRSMVIKYKTSHSGELFRYKIDNLNINPLSSGEFSTKVLDGTPALEWNFWALGCD